MPLPKDVCKKVCQIILIGGSVLETEYLKDEKSSSKRFRDKTMILCTSVRKHFSEA